MKSGFLLFFSIVLGVLTLVDFYIWLHGYQALEVAASLRLPYTIAFIAVAYSYLVGQWLEHRGNWKLARPFTIVGAFWFAAMAYFFIGVVVIDLVRLVHHFVNFYPDAITQHYGDWKLLLMVAMMLIVGLILVIGNKNATEIRMKKLDLAIEKPAEKEVVRIVAISDQHIGTIIGRERLSEMVRAINAEEPDIVLFVGDQIDGDPRPAINNNLGELFRQIKAPHGKFAITGNHEYIGDAERSIKYLEDHGLMFLRDGWTEALGMTIVGREDRSLKQFTGEGRKQLAEILEGIDRKNPMILLDHQPFHLEEAEDAGADLQLSGHTHHAQLWPLSYITRAIYEVSWGYKRRGTTHYYVSCGAGTWGPPVTIGSHSEIVSITLRFSGRNSAFQAA